MPLPASRNIPAKHLMARVIRFLILLLILTGCSARHLAHHYDSPERAAWQMPDRVVQELAIVPGSSVADLGSGGGYFTLRLAKAVGPQGKVYAVDVDPEMHNYLRKKLATHDITNVELILASEDDPKLPPGGVDLIFSVNVYHHLKDRAQYFKNARRYLKPGGRVAIIDFREGAFRHFTRSEVIRGEMETAGYTLERELDFLPRQHFLIFALKEN